MILKGDCRETLKEIADGSVASIVTDPPYEIGFMGKGWDGSGVANDPELWAECFRVLKPGGHVLAFGAARTYHRMACAIEDAGFEIRDSIHWVYGSGFPKSHNVSKGIDKAAGAERNVLGTTKTGARSIYPNGDSKALNPLLDITAPSTVDARKWDGWGTALKPAHEPIVMARKPFPGTVAQNVLEHGTGAINIDATRIGTPITHQAGRGGIPSGSGNYVGSNKPPPWQPTKTESGRWPANVILTHNTECGPECTPDCPAIEIDRQSGMVKGGTWNQTDGARHFDNDGKATNYSTTKTDNTQAGASRFYAQPEWALGDYLASVYTPKAGKKERNAGLDNNNHPTVKPVALMRYLVRLVTPPGGTVLDPFLGSGTTAVAAILEGYDWMGCELTAEYLPIIEARCQWARENIEIPEPTLFDGDTI